ncbi:MAG: MBL fold metallo-hydrolase [Leptolyngbyaceae cyanobacterium bins.302]|nr:MBL fold metallo-hydrolase [Leptolyngbyaceae cyanobacterium bins.302]
MATLLFLGSGSAYTLGTNNFQSNMLLTSDRGETLLVDCGTDIRFSLHAADLSYQDISSIYVSHLHSDHAGGLEYIGFSRKFDPDCDRPTIYTSADIAVDLWDRTLSGGMRSLHQELATLETFFQPEAIEVGGAFTWEGIHFQLVAVDHVHNGIFQMPAYGLFFELNNIRIFISSDCQVSWEQNRYYYEMADVIFHDCETTPFSTPVHAHYSDLSLLPEAVRRKMWLYGYQPGRLPDATLDGFRGFVQQGQQFEFSANLISSSESLVLVA